LQGNSFHGGTGHPKGLITDDRDHQAPYTVVAGDTVDALSRRFGKRWVDIAIANKLEDVNLILIGQKLIIPAQGVARGM